MHMLKIVVVLFFLNIAFLNTLSATKTAMAGIHTESFSTERAETPSVWDGSMAERKTPLMPMECKRKNATFATPSKVQ